MTNNEIFVMFLKHNRKYSAFKHNMKKATDYILYDNRPCVQRALLNSFCWLYSKEENREYWKIVSDKWVKLCEDLNLQGEINLEEFIDD